MDIDIDAVVDGYVETLLWSESCNGTAPNDVCDHYGRTGDERADCDKSLEYLNYEQDNIAPEAMMEIRNDVEAFCESNADDLIGLRPWDIGHNFLLSRNGHGAGFFDRGWGARGDRLQESSRPYGTTYAYVGDDGLIYVD